MKAGLSLDEYLIDLPKMNEAGGKKTEFVVGAMSSVPSRLLTSFG